jgi:hypothetical protein
VRSSTPQARNGSDLTPETTAPAAEASILGGGRADAAVTASVIGMALRAVFPGLNETIVGRHNLQRFDASFRLKR